jgi:hypothetical protein
MKKPSPTPAQRYLLGLMADGVELRSYATAINPIRYVLVGEVGEWRYGKGVTASAQTMLSRGWIGLSRRSGYFKYYAITPEGRAAIKGEG